MKAVLIGIIIIAVELICGILIYNTYSDQTYAEIYAGYRQVATERAEEVKEAVGASADYSSPQVQEEVKSVAGDDCVLFRVAGGEIAGEGWAISGNISSYGLSYNDTKVFDSDGTSYIFSAAPLNEFYSLAVVQDFTARQSEIDALISNMTAYLVIAGIFIIAAFIFYVNWAGYRVFAPRHEYKFTVGKDGKILKYNAKFRTDFGAITKIDTDFCGFTDKCYNLISLEGLNGEKTLSFTVDKNKKSCTVRADEIKNSSEVAGACVSDETCTGRARLSLSKAYNEFVHRGARTLLGIIVIVNLNRISALFGKEMALNVQKEIVRRAQEKFRHVYELDFGRMGVAFPDGARFNQMISEMAEVLAYIGQPIKIDDNLFSVDLKSGFALCDSSMPSEDFDYAMQAAEAALSRCIDCKISEFLIYHESQKSIYAKYFIRYDIKQMLIDGAFELEYQPQYSIRDNRIEGFEALFRVKKSWNVNVDTFSFITYAERTGAMVQLGDFIFDTGMRFAKQLEGKNVSVSLNVSPVQLMQAGFTQNFLRIYNKYNLKRGSVCVEITESFLMNNFDETLSKLSILKDNGIDIHLDDFGTQYSSLLYIKKLPVSTIKIDKEFVDDVVKDKASQAVIRFINNIARLIGCKTICEGVETPQEFDMLKALGCDTVQGWLIGRSMPPEDALKIIDTFDYETAAAEAKARQSQVKQPRFCD